MDDLVPIITAIIALVGSALGVYVGYRKWSRERHAERFGHFAKDQQAVYKELWDRVEAFNIKVRIEEVTSEEFSTHLRELNTFMLEKGLYFDDADRSLANDYARAVFDFQASVRAADQLEAEIALGDTGDIPTEVTTAFREIGDTQERALELRSELRGKIRLVIGGVR